MTAVIGDVRQRQVDPAARACRARSAHQRLACSSGDRDLTGGASRPSFAVHRTRARHPTSASRPADNFVPHLTLAEHAAGAAGDRGRACSPTSGWVDRLGSRVDPSLGARSRPVPPSRSPSLRGYAARRRRRADGRARRRLGASCSSTAIQRHAGGGTAFRARHPRSRRPGRLRTACSGSSADV